MKYTSGTNESLISETLRKLNHCMEHGGIVNGFPTRVRLNDARALKVLVEFMQALAAEKPSA